MKYKQGCLIEAALSGEVDVIAHQCNCFNTMKSGIAPKIAKAFPKAHRADQITIKGSKDKLGGFTVAGGAGHSPAHRVTVFNLYGQYNFGWQEQHTDYKALRRSLYGMVHFLSQRLEAKIGLPLLGCGLGGGSWDEVSKIVEETLGHLDVTIYYLNESDKPEETNVCI